MITFNISWYLGLMIVVEIIGLIWIFNKDNFNGMLGSARSWAAIFYVIASIIGWLIYGGFVWW